MIDNRRRLIFLFAVFLFADAFIKKYITASAFSHSAVYPYFIYSIFFILLLSGGRLFWSFCKDFEFQDLWTRNTQTTPVDRSRLAFITILAIAVILRFWKIDSLYSGLWFDEAYKGLDAISIRRFGDRPIVLDWNLPREAMVAYLVAASTSLFGYSIFAIRAVEALAGSLTVLFFYLFVRTIFNTRVALLSAFLLAVAKEHLIYSRMGFRVPLYVLFEVLTLYLLALAMKRNKNSTLLFVGTGCAAALGFYTYLSYRIFPLILLAFLADVGLRGQIRGKIKGLAIAAVAACVVIAPLVVFFLNHPLAFSYRMQTVALWTDRSQPFLKLLYVQTKNTLGMFTFIGDPIARQNVNAEPALSPFITGFFLLGILLTLANIRKRYAMFLLLYFALNLLPSIFSIQNPHTGRTLGAIPPAAIFAAIGIFAVRDLLKTIAPSLANLMLIVILGGSLLTGGNDALFRYSAYLDANDPEAGMNRLEKKIYDLVQRQGSECQFYLTPQVFFHTSIEYLSYPSPKHKLYTKHTEFQSDKISIVVFVTIPRHLWWITDDEGKRYFKWWEQFYGWKTADIRKWNNEMYLLPPKIELTDLPLLQQLKKQHPNGREARFDDFTVYLFR